MNQARVSIRQHWTHPLLSACGIDPRHSWGKILLSFFFILPSCETSKPFLPHLADLFPHIQFTRPRLGDLIRFPLQLIWLMLVIPPYKDNSPPKPSL
ncbi:MAG: hypothetical protein PHI06_11110, partial [Desulfobulbaceae bacterium]|nr:hypothetical protein [Desulfobulbaceae bacterium]